MAARCRHAGRLARVARRQSQDQLGARAGVARVTVGSVERGDHPAAVTVYVRLARALGLSPDELFAGEL